MDYFAFFSVLRDCGCISIKLKHNAVKHYMCFGLSYFFYDIYAMFLVFKASAPPDQGFSKVFKKAPSFSLSK